MSDTLASLLTSDEGAFLGKFISPATEHLGTLARERAQQLGQQATALLTTVGREPQPVEPKLLMPLVQAASLESDPTLSAYWAALLANAADSAQRVRVQPGFAEVLRQLTIDDAVMLDFLYAELKRNDEIPAEPVTVSYIYQYFKWGETRMEVSIDNLLRLRLIDTLIGAVYGPAPTIRENTNIGGTAFGRAFLAAVTPPTP